MERIRMKNKQSENSIECKRAFKGLFNKTKWKMRQTK